MHNWLKQAACSDQITVMHKAIDGNATATRQARHICAACPVNAECLQDSMKETDYVLYGVFGGIDRAGRRWLEDFLPHGGKRQLDAVFAACHNDHETAVQLREHVEEVGPGNEAIARFDNDPAKLAKAYAVTVALARKWVASTEPESQRRVGNRSPETERLFEILSDGHWHPRRDVVAAMAAAVSADRAAHKASQRTRSTGRYCTPLKGAEWLARASIGYVKRGGRVIEDGRGRLRLAQVSVDQQAA